MKQLVLSLFFLTCFGFSAFAQDAPALPTPQPTSAQPQALATCPVQTEGAFNATKLICTNLVEGEACIGNGVVEATFNEGVTNTVFSQPNERTLLINFAELRLRTLDTENALWSVVATNNLLATTTGNIAPTNMFVFGDVTLEDDGDVVQVPEGNQRIGTVLADFGLIIRRKPDASAGIAWQLLKGDQVTVTGQTVDKTWFRVNIPSDFGGVGWVYAPYMEVSGDQATVPYVDENSPVPTAQPIPTVEFGTMQAFRLISAKTDASCVGTPDSGVVLQSPNGIPDRVRVRINGVVIEFSGTIFVQAQADADLRVNVLEGEALVEAVGTSVTATANNRAVVGMGSNVEPTSAPSLESFDIAPYATLPIALLARPIALSASVVASPTEVATDAALATAIPEAVTDTTAATATTTSTDALPTPISVGSLESNQLGQICGQGAVSLNQTASNDISTVVGGLWTATTGTTINISVLQGTFQPLIGSFIKIQAITGVLAQSGDQQNLTYTFSADATFSILVSSKVGDNLLVTLECAN